MKENERILARFKGLDLGPVERLTETGQITILGEDGGRPLGAMSAHVVHASERTAWNTLKDFEKYPSFLPGIDSAKVLSKSGEPLTVRFEAGVKVMGVGGSLRYSYRFDFDGPYMNVTDAKTDEAHSYWAVFPTGHADRVLLAHADAARDVRSYHLFVRFLLERIPNADIGFHVSIVSMLVNRMKKRMEQMEKRASSGG